ncbi:MAG: FAD-dependent oxidoreductase [Candidatus Acetothermia bacterium]
MEFTRLFSPIQIGDLRLSSRVAMAPMGNHLQDPSGAVTEELISYFRERARGGVEMIISPFAAVRSGLPTFGVYSDELLPGLRELCQAVHAEDGKIFLQIAHLGGKYEKDPVAPSAIKSELYPEIPHELTTEEVEQLIEDFVEAADRARKADFDGVEVHGAHTYLLGQFMSPHTNRREDEYGGEFQGRMKFVTEIVKGIRRKVGDEFPMGFKFSAHEHVPNGIDLPQALRIAEYMEDLGVDYLHVSSTSSTLAAQEDYCKFPSVPSLYASRAPLMELASGVKKRVDIPVIGTGGITRPQVAEELLAEDQADIIAVGRGFIADPQWVEKTRNGTPLRPCIRCNECHRKEVFEEKPVRCTVNPAAGRETEFLNSKVSSADGKKVAVVGGGPAGMEAALTAVEQGHEVTLYESEGQLGGLMKPAVVPPFKEDVRRLLDHYRWRVERCSDLNLKLNCKVTEDSLESSAWGAVILATGSRPLKPEIDGLEALDYRFAHQLLLEESYPPSPILILGAGLVGSETAAYLAQEGREVVLVDLLPREEILKAEHPTNRAALLHLLDQKNVSLHPASTLEKIEPGRGELVTPAGEETIDFSSFVLAAGFEPNDQLLELLKGRSGLESSRLFQVGDCKEPKRLYQAIQQGNEVARNL